MTIKLLILKRDGVINHSAGETIKSAEQWQAIPGSIEALAQLHKAGFTLVVATNQPGIAEGDFDLDELEAIHAKLSTLVEEAGGAISAIFYCPHGPEDRCNCRLPKAGLIDAIEAEFDISAQGVPFIGNHINDVLAGETKACRNITLKSHADEVTLSALEVDPDKSQIFDNLTAAAEHLVAELT
mgnify:CR=1 FL=1